MNHAGRPALAAALTAAALVVLADYLPAQRAVRDGVDAPQRLLQGQVGSNDDSAALLRRVRVALVGSQAPPVFTDHEGRFEIQVPERGWALRFSKAGFAPRIVQGSPDPSVPFLSVRLDRGAAINGRVLDGAGLPVVDARVRVRQLLDPAQRGQLPVTVFVRTDDLGEFRVGSLPAGRYDVDADGSSRQTTLGSPQVTRIDAPAVSADTAPAEARGTSPNGILARTAEEVNVVITFDRRNQEFRAAANYAESAESGMLRASMDAFRTPYRGGANSRMLPMRGGATVTGRVTDHLGRPVSGAIVRLDPVTPALPRTAASDTGGFYRFTGVAEASYRVSATKTGFIEAEYGQGRAGQPGAIVSARNQQVTDGIDIALRRGAAITGSVRDADAWRLQYRNGLPITQAVGTGSRTDDRGGYRVHSLPPGTYFVVAADDPSGSANAAAVTRAPRSFYPGTSNMAQAAPVHVDVGLDAAGVDMIFASPRTVRVSGRALDSGGNPLNRAVVLVGSARSQFPAPAPQVAEMRGTAFEFPHVTPGEYVIQAMQYRGDLPESPLPTEFVVQQVSVGEQDVENVVVRTTPGSAVTGFIRMEGGTQPAIGGEWLTVAAVDPDFEPAPVLPRPRTITVSPDLTFRMTGLWGPLRVTSRWAMTSAWLKAAHLTGVNIADQFALFGRRDERGLEVVLASDGATVAGRVVNARKERVQQYVVAVLPVAAGLRYGGSRYIRLVRPNERAEFDAGMMPPGDYVAVALDALEEAEVHDPAIVRQLLEAGRRVTLEPRERFTADLPLVRLTR